MIANKITNLPVERLKIPPHSDEAEQSILGALLIVGQHDKNIREVRDLIRPEMFYNRQHQIIYRAMQKLDGVIDMTTVESALAESDELEESGGFMYLGELAHNLPSAANVLKYCDIVRDRYNKRQVLSISQVVTDKLYSGEPVTDVLESFTNLIQQIDMSGSYTPAALSNMVEGWVDLMERRVNGDVEAIGVKTGIEAIDNQIGGIKPSWLVTLSGRPSMGKTIIAQQINSHIAKSFPTLFFSMEMDEQELVDRYIALMAGIEPESVRLGTLSASEQQRFGAFWADNHHANVLYDCEPALSLHQIANRARRAKKKYGKLGLITIDYLFLMNKPKADRMDLSIAEITRGLKQLAKEIQTPILLLAQANRDADNKARAQMNNIADSSAIEKDSDLILFVHREEVMNPDNVPMRGITELYAAKFRHGDCHKTAYLTRKSDVEGGQWYCLNDKEMGYIEAQIEADEREAEPKRDGKLKSKYKRGQG